MDSLSKAMDVDLKLMTLASYAVSEGMPLTSEANDFESMIKKSMEHRRKVNEKFIEFKSLIRSGEFFLYELEDYVCGKYGPFLQPPLRNNIDFDSISDDDLNKIIAEEDFKDSLYEKSCELSKLDLGKIINSLNGLVDNLEDENQDDIGQHFGDDLNGNNSEENDEEK